MSYKLDDRVKLVRLGGDALENSTGTVKGIAISNVINHYIIEVDQLPTVAWPWKCISITESCLERL